MTAQQPTDRPAASEGQPVGLPPLPEPVAVVSARLYSERAVRNAYEAGKRDAVAALTADPDVVMVKRADLAAVLAQTEDGFEDEDHAWTATLARLDAALTDTLSE